MCIIKQSSYFLCIACVFIFCSIKADKVYEPTIVKINDILVYENVANEIIRNTKAEIDIITKEANVITIKNSELLKEIIKLFNKAISNKDDDNIVCVKSERNKIVMYVKKKEKLIIGIIIDE